MPSPAWKWNQHLHKACQQKEAWSALKFPGRWLQLTLYLWKHSGPTPADNTAAQIITDCGNFTLGFKQLGFGASTLSPDPGTLISKWNAKFTFIWKEDFGPLSNSPVICLLSPGKMLLMMFRLCLTVFSSLGSLVTGGWGETPPPPPHMIVKSFGCTTIHNKELCKGVIHSFNHLCCLWTFPYPISSFQSTVHLICFDTALLEQPPLSVMTLCYLPPLWRVSMIAFWTIAKPAVLPIIVVSKNKKYPEFILYGWSLIETQM